MSTYKTIVNRAGTSSSITLTVPATTTDREIVVFSGTTGAAITGSGINVDSGQNVGDVRSISFTAVGANPGDSTAVWLNSDGHLYVNTVPLIGTTTTDSLTNKSLVDTSTFIVDATDATKKIGFDAGGTTGTTTTITAAQTANRVITLPDATDTLVGKATSDSLTNKNLVDSSTYIVDAVDATKRIAFNANSSTGSTVTITTTATQDRTITLPNATTTLVGCASSGTANAIPVFSATNIVTTSNIIASVDTTLSTLLITSTATPTLGIAANDNVLLGKDPGKIGTSPLNYQGCTFLGAHAGAANNGSANFITAVGSHALNANASVTGSNVAVGDHALYSTTAAGLSVAAGAAAGYNIVTSSNDVLLGHRAGYSLGDSATNVMVGAFAAGASLGTAATGWANNVCIGYQAGYNTSAGNTALRNIFIGYQAGNTVTNNTDCVYLDNVGVAAETLTTRIGTNQTKAFMAGIRGRTTVNNNAVAVLVDSAGQLGTVSSSLKYKENVVDLEDSEVVYDMRPVKFNYIGQTKPSIGLIAEEIEQTYPEMAVYQPREDGPGEELLTVDYARLPILLLAQIQKLNARIALLESRAALI
jgi:hypothetical protein